MARAMASARPRAAPCRPVTPFNRIENAMASPGVRPSTKPESAIASFSVPVFARTMRGAGSPVSRFSSVPSTPAMARCATYSSRKARL
jgi:hypothetical protein